MRLSTKGRYAVTAMMEIALNDGKGPVTLAEISATQGISNSYLEQLFAQLRKHGLVKGLRGPRGGYRLARQPSEITVASILRAVDEKIDTMRCNGEGNCRNGEPCLTHELWSELSDALYQFLDGITLAEYVDRPVVRQISRQQHPASEADLKSH